ncbi:hypothetical protein [Tamlana flava]|uniref:hypothetical protein n=1 Tax=Tamlana flava TaxID=3158572 RepID=UPI00351B816E
MATKYPEMPYQTEMSLYSCSKNSAPINAVAVWPEGNELLVDASGLSTLPELLAK